LTSAVAESGLNEKPLCPTLITTVLAAAVAARAVRRRNCIVLMLRIGGVSFNVFEGQVLLFGKA